MRLTHRFPVRVARALGMIAEDHGYPEILIACDRVKRKAFQNWNNVALEPRGIALIGSVLASPTVVASMLLGVSPKQLISNDRNDLRRNDRVGRARIGALCPTIVTDRRLEMATHFQWYALPAGIEPDHSGPRRSAELLSRSIL